MDSNLNNLNPWARRESPVSRSDSSLNERMAGLGYGQTNPDPAILQANSEMASLRRQLQEVLHRQQIDSAENRRLNTAYQQTLADLHRLQAEQHTTPP